ARSFRLVHLLDSPCLSLNAQQGIRFSGASSVHILENRGSFSMLCIMVVIVLAAHFLPAP
ncbi:hypothetical protein, partial [Burkholderia sp. BCC0398]|uniref:hypothetical protein n=1 Tax=Burkholderia sp. BCC0398 TaxID=2676297 RepID=UPI001ABAA519